MLSVYLVLTDSCNLLCPSCIRKNISESGVLSIEHFEKIIFTLKKHTSNCSINITGGEPFLNTIWEYITRKCFDEFGKVCICSNGMISDVNIEKLKIYLKDGIYLQISIDGDEDADTAIRGEYHYNSVINTIKSLSDYSNKLILSTSIDRRNIGRIENLINTLNTLRFLFWKVSWIQSLHPKNDYNMLTSEEWNKFVDEILPLCYFPTKIPRLFDFNLFDEATHCSHNLNMSIRNCGFGKQKIYIFPNGDVYPCSCYSSWKIGNILIDSFEEILRKIDCLTNFTIPTDSICYSCKYKDLCNSGCPGYSMKMYGKLGYGDIRCPLVRKQYDKEYKNIYNGKM